MVYLPSYITLAISLGSVAHGLSVTNAKRAPTTIQNTFAGILPRAQAFNAATSKLSSSTTRDQYWDFLAAAQGLTQVNQKDAFLGALNQATLTDAEVIKLLPVVKSTVDELITGVDRLTSHIKDFWTLPEDDLRLIVSSTRYFIGAIRWDFNSYFDRILKTYPRIPASTSSLIQEQATRYYDKLYFVQNDWWNVKTLSAPTNRTTPAVDLSWKNAVLADLERRVARSADFKNYAASLTADASEGHYQLALDLEGQIWLPGVTQTLRELNKFDSQTSQKALALTKTYSANILEAHSTLTSKWSLIQNKPWAKNIQILLIFETRDGTQFSDYFDGVRRLVPSSLYGDFNALDSAFRSQWNSLSNFWYGTSA